MRKLLRCPSSWGDIFCMDSPANIEEMQRQQCKRRRRTFFHGMDASELLSGGAEVRLQAYKDLLARLRPMAKHRCRVEGFQTFGTPSLRFWARAFASPSGRKPSMASPAAQPLAHQHH